MIGKKKALTAVLFAAAIPVLAVVVVFTIGLCRGVVAQFHDKPVFFGVEIGERYNPAYALDIKGSVGTYLFWLRHKYQLADRPYAFGGVRLEKNVQGKICRIEKFYEQDMALLLVTKSSKRVIGVVVAAKCRSEEIDNVVREISGVIRAKHKNVTLINKLEPWQNAAMLRFARRPALDRVVVPTVSRQIVCVDENFEVTIMGTRFKMIEEPIRSVRVKTDENLNVLGRVSNAVAARFAYDDASIGDDDYLRMARISDLEKWQVEPQTLEEMFEEKELKACAVKQDVDPDAAYVYVLVMAHNYEEEIAADRVEARMDDQRRKVEQGRELEHAREKNASAL